MEKDQNDQLEILLRSPIGNGKPSVETLIEICAQFTGFSKEMAKYYKAALDSTEKNTNEDFMDSILGYILWSFLSKANSVISLTVCQKDPKAVIELETILKKFAQKMKLLEGIENDKKSQNKKEETFFKENPDIN